MEKSGNLDDSVRNIWRFLRGKKQHQGATFEIAQSFTPPPSPELASELWWPHTLKIGHFVKLLLFFGLFNNASVPHKFQAGWGTWNVHTRLP